MRQRIKSRILDLHAVLQSMAFYEALTVGIVWGTVLIRLDMLWRIITW